MAYTKKNNGNSRNNRNNSNNNNNSNSNGKKHSGAKIVWGKKDGQKYISAWNYSRRHGLLSFFVSDYKKTKTVKSASGREWSNVMVKISGAMRKEQIVSGLLDVASNKVIVQELGIVINPNAPNGGYCGKFY